MKRLLLISISALLISCAESKKININGEDVIVEPYGWMNESEIKNDSVVYRVNTGNIVWSVLGIETLVVPIVLTGNYMYEPIRKK